MLVLLSIDTQLRLSYCNLQTGSPRVLPRSLRSYTYVTRSPNFFPSLLGDRSLATIMLYHRGSLTWLSKFARITFRRVCQLSRNAHIFENCLLYLCSMIFSNYWMRLSRIWSGILQVKEGVILRKPNSLIALLFIRNISSFWSKRSFAITLFVFPLTRV